MRSYFSLSVPLFVLVFSASVNAQVPHTFTDGTTALAAQVNANFSALVEQIQDLQDQVNALQSQSNSGSVVGTWDIYEIRSASFENSTNGRIINGGGGVGTVTFNSNGTFSASSTTVEPRLEFIVAIPPGTNTIQSTITTPNDSESDSGTYTVSGSNIILTDAEGQSTIVFSGGVLVASNIENGQVSLTIGIKR